MPKVNYRGEVFTVPDRINGKKMSKVLGLSKNEIPVVVKPNGDYEPIGYDEYHVPREGETVDKVNRIANGSRETKT